MLPTGGIWRWRHGVWLWRRNVRGQVKSCPMRRWVESRVDVDIEVLANAALWL
jgi:hypothetical protein